MLAILGLFVTMVSLITWAIPMVTLSQGNAGVGPLSITLDKTTYNRRYKLCRMWATIGAIGCIGGLILAYVACYWLT